MNVRVPYKDPSNGDSFAKLKKIQFRIYTWQLVNTYGPFATQNVLMQLIIKAQRAFKFKLSAH